MERMEYQVLSSNPEIEKLNITALVYDSRKIVPGCVFVCIKGAVFDGHTCIGEAAQKQAAAVIVERQTENYEGMATILVDDTRLALAMLSAALPGRKERRRRHIW